MKIKLSEILKNDNKILLTNMARQSKKTQKDEESSDEELKQEKKKQEKLASDKKKKDKESKTHDDESEKREEQDDVKSDEKEVKQSEIDTKKKDESAKSDEKESKQSEITKNTSLLEKLAEQHATEPKSIADFDVNEIKKLDAEKTATISSFDLLKILSVRGDASHNPALRFGTLRLLKELNCERPPRNDNSQRSFRGNSNHFDRRNYGRDNRFDGREGRTDGRFRRDGDEEQKREGFKNPFNVTDHRQTGYQRQPPVFNNASGSEQSHFNRASFRGFGTQKPSNELNDE